MEGQESLLDTLFDEDNFNDGQDVEMMDVEEGELIEQVSKTKVGETSHVDDIQENQESNRPNSRRNKKKKKNKRKRGGSCSTGPNVTDINRFVLDACKRLRERKSYLMHTAVGCLGAAALSDLIKEVDAIQACGGQMTANGRRSRNGGGILWNIIKVRDPNAYKEIMKKGKEFEKQFTQQKQEPLQHTETSFKNVTLDASQKQFTQQKQEPRQHTKTSFKNVTLDANQVVGNPLDDLELPPHDQSQHDISTAEQKRAPVHDRLRMPVIYDDDLFVGQDFKDKLA